MDDMRNRGVCILINGMSLFSGAGGMDIGFERANVNILFANEMNKDACATYTANRHDPNMVMGDINGIFDILPEYRDRIDVLFGGPPCQGFSVAGKMDPNDDRSTLIWKFVDAVEVVRPRSFVMENVKALGVLEKWRNVRKEFLKRTSALGYNVTYFILNASDFGVPQNRERVFFVGIHGSENKSVNYIEDILRSHRKMPSTTREILSALPPAGSTGNPLTCNAKITLAERPVMRRSPYAGMYFNGMGRPLNLDGASNTLPASMGGNKTPIIDDEYLRDPSAGNWPASYHKMLIDGSASPCFTDAPLRLRRITIKEAAAIQTFPDDYIFKGSKTSVYAQIGNAVPCNMSEAIAKSVVSVLRGTDVKYAKCVSLNSYMTDESKIQQVD